MKKELGNRAVYSAFDSAASCGAGGSAAGGGRRKEKSGKRAIDVARESGYQLDDRYQPAGSIITEIHTGQILWEENKDVSWAWPV